QRDVLKSCAKLRSAVIDRLNIIEYIQDNTAQFVLKPGDSDRLSNLHAAISGDYDIIEDAASYAIDNAKLAVEPETYARTVKNLANYSLTTLSGLPSRVDASSILVPDFSQARDWDAMNAMATKNKLTLNYVNSGANPTYVFVSQSPAAGTNVAVGTTVTVVGKSQPPRPFLVTPMFLGVARTIMRPTFIGKH
ncbi:MAG TPA: hypothetical protein VKB71_13440, partial [Rhizomicrobium sp.]|nr:hypothetical protein [Rhizomicrobium sp.]